MRIVVKQNGAVCSDLQFEEEMVYIGSKAGSSILLSSPNVAQQHAVLSPDSEESWSLAPVAPNAAITLNGIPLESKRPVKPGDRIGIGQFELRVEPNGQVAALDEKARAEAVKSLPVSTIFKGADDSIMLSARRFNRLSRISHQIAQCRDLRSLLDMTLTQVLQAFLDTRMAWVGVRRQPRGRLEFVEGRLSNGNVADAPPLMELLHNRCIERSLMLCVPKIENKEHGSVMAVPLISARGVLGMIYVDGLPEASPYRERQLNLMIGIAAQTTLQLEAIIDDQLRSQAAVSAEQASLANHVQTRLDPKVIPQWPGIQLAAYCKPGQERCSDVYDLLKLNSGAGGIFIAKAKADNTEALLMMTEVRAAFRVACLHNDPPHAFLREINWLLHDEKEQRRLDVLAVVMDPASGEIRYASAGECHGVIVNQRGEPRALSKHAGPPVGVTKSPEYRAAAEVLKPGETLGLFTGGMAAATNAKGKTLAVQQVIDCLCDGFGQPAGNTLDDLVVDLSDYLKAGRQPEDITLLILHREKDLGLPPAQ